MSEQTQETPKTSPRDMIAKVVSILKRSVRFWPVVLASVLLSVVTAIVVPKVMKPLFQTNTVLMYQEGIQTGNVVGASGHEGRAESRRDVGMRLVAMLTSRSNLEKLVIELFPEWVKRDGIIEAVDNLRKQIDCGTRDGQTFVMTFKGDSPDEVYRAITRLTESLIELSSKLRVEQAEATKQFLEAEKERTAKELKEKEEALANFLAAHPEFAQETATASAGASVRAAERRTAGVGTGIQAMERQATRLRQQISGRASSAPAGGGAGADQGAANAGPAVDPQTAAAIAGAEAELATARRTLAEAQARFTQQHPDVVAAQAKEQEAAARVRDLKARARANPQSAPRTASPGPAPVVPTPQMDENRKAQLAQELARLESSIKASKQSSSDGSDSANWIVDLETQWASLNRDTAEARERDQQLQDRLFRASMVANIEATGRSGQMLVVDAPFKPERPIKKDPKRVAAVSALVTILLGVGAAIGLTFLDDRVYSELELRSLDLGPVVHVIPREASPATAAATATGKRNG